jgi:hypothetical protein
MKKFSPPVQWKPGIYSNIPFEAYLGIEAANSSFLKALMRSPAHAHYDKMNPKPSTESQRTGRIVHAGVLEPTRFKRDFKQMPGYDSSPRNRTASGERSYSKATKYYKEQAEKFHEKFKKREIITKEEYELATAARKAFMGFELSRAILDRQGPVEQTILWNENIGEESFQPQPVLCKIRPDKWMIVDGELIVIDVKTTVNAAPKPFGFWKEIDKYRYDIQAAMYLTGFRRMAEMGLIPQFTTSRFVLLAIEKEGMYAAHPHELADAWIEVGERDFKKLLALYQECKAKNVWPLWGNEASIAHPPHYRMQEGFDD